MAMDPAELAMQTAGLPWASFTFLRASNSWIIYSINSYDLIYVYIYTYLNVQCKCSLKFISFESICILYPAESRILRQDKHIFHARRAPEGHCIHQLPGVVVDLRAQRQLELLGFAKLLPGAPHSIKPKPTVKSVKSVQTIKKVL